MLAILIVILIMFDVYLIALLSDERAQRQQLAGRVLDLELRHFAEDKRNHVD